MAQMGASTEPGAFSAASAASCKRVGRRRSGEGIVTALLRIAAPQHSQACIGGSLPEGALRALSCVQGGGGGTEAVAGCGGCGGGARGRSASRRPHLRDLHRPKGPGRHLGAAGGRPPGCRASQARGAAGCSEGGSGEHGDEDGGAAERATKDWGRVVAPTASRGVHSTLTTQLPWQQELHMAACNA